MDKKLDDIGETLQVFARIEERQIATNERMAELSERTKDQEQRLRSIEMALPENLDKRLSIIEAAMPQLKETRRWVVMGILGGLGMMGTAVGHMILTK